MKISCIIVFVLVSCSFAEHIDTISADCDVEFAEAATKLAAEHVKDPVIVKYIHAVLSSCNKAPIQKMAEISVFLLEKGTITPQVMGEIKVLFEKLRKRKEGDMNQKISELPPELYSTAQKIRNIVTSGGLSGNERKIEIEEAVHAVPPSYRQMVAQLFQNSPPKLDGSKIEQRPNKPIEITTPASFAIQKQVEIEPPIHNEFRTVDDSNFDRTITYPRENSALPRVNAPFQQHVAQPQPIITSSKQNVLFPDLPPVELLYPPENIPISQINPINSQSIPENLKGILNNPNFDKILNAIVQKGAKIADGPLPKSVGTVDHSTPDIKSFNLLNPNSWSDAARLLSQSSNDLPTALSQFMEKNSIPQVFAPKTSSIRQSPIKIDQDVPYLPNRRLNDGALDSYDTHIDRFASSGPSNRIQVQGDLSKLQLIPIETNGRPSPIQPNKVDSIIGAMPTMPPSTGYGTYAPAPAVIVPQVREQNKLPEEITGSYRQPNSGIYNRRMSDGTLRNVRIDVVNEQ